MSTQKAILEFDLTDMDAKKTFNRMMKADSAFSALWDISQEIFRPARKHGYHQGRHTTKLNEILGLHNTDEETPQQEQASEAIHLLEQMFYDLLKDKGIDLDEDYN